MRERRYHIRGRVQGVGFRWWIRGHAQRLGVSGTVRNCDDGSVEVCARGSDAQLAALRRLLERGPPAASVEGIEETDITGVPEAGFAIAR